jgi:hypothetical protein
VAQQNELVDDVGENLRDRDATQRARPQLQAITSSLNSGADVATYVQFVEAAAAAERLSAEASWLQKRAREDADKASSEAHAREEDYEKIREEIGASETDVENAYLQFDIALSEQLILLQEFKSADRLLVEKRKALLEARKDVEQFCEVRGNKEWANPLVPAGLWLRQTWGDDRETEVGEAVEDVEDECAVVISNGAEAIGMLRTATTQAIKEAERELGAARERLVREIANEAELQARATTATEDAEYRGGATSDELLSRAREANSGLYAARKKITQAQSIAEIAKSTLVAANKLKAAIQQLVDERILGQTRRGETGLEADNAMKSRLMGLDVELYRHLATTTREQRVGIINNLWQAFAVYEQGGGWDAFKTQRQDLDDLPDALWLDYMNLRPLTLNLGVAEESLAAARSNGGRAAVKQAELVVKARIVEISAAMWHRWAKDSLMSLVEQKWRREKREPPSQADMKHLSGLVKFLHRGFQGTDYYEADRVIFDNEGDPTPLRVRGQGI